MLAKWLEIAGTLLTHMCCCACGACGIGIGVGREVRVWSDAVT